MNRIAIISNNSALRQNLKGFLSEENFLVSFPTLEEIHEGMADIIFIDFDELKDIQPTDMRKELYLPNIPLVAIINEESASKFNPACGVDEFIFDTIPEKELFLRIKFLFSRVHGTNNDDIIQIQNLTIDLAQHKVLINYQPIDLTYMEFKLLQFFVTNKDRVFSRNYILERVWGYDYYGGTRTVDVHVRRLRSKLGGKYENSIQTVRNVGYKFSLNF